MEFEERSWTLVKVNRGLLPEASISLEDAIENDYMAHFAKLKKSLNPFGSLPRLVKTTDMLYTFLKTEAKFIDSCLYSNIRRRNYSVVGILWKLFENGDSIFLEREAIYRKSLYLALESGDARILDIILSTNMVDPRSIIEESFEFINMEILGHLFRRGLLSRCQEMIDSSYRRDLGKSFLHREKTVQATFLSLLGDTTYEKELRLLIKKYELPKAEGENFISRVLYFLYYTKSDLLEYYISIFPDLEEKLIAEIVMENDYESLKKRNIKWNQLNVVPFDRLQDMLVAIGRD